ncbi:MAG TPA: hypothetical protein VMB77_14560 [Syntrophales bacterium]|nr:hypothetical protein [Syntrophales bacterium]
MAVWMTVWLERYRWVFALATFAFLALAYHQMREAPSRVNRWSFYATAVLCAALLLFMYLYR